MRGFFVGQQAQSLWGARQGPPFTDLVIMFEVLYGGGALTEQCTVRWVIEHNSVLHVSYIMSLSLCLSLYLAVFQCVCLKSEIISFKFNGDERVIFYVSFAMFLRDALYFI